MEGRPSRTWLKVLLQGFCSVLLIMWALRSIQESKSAQELREFQEKYRALGYPVTMEELKEAHAVPEGEEQLRKGFQARQDNKARMSRHVCNNLLIDVIDEDNATGTVYLTLYRHDGEEDRSHSPIDGPSLVGEYRDRFVRTAEGWRFCERVTVISFVRQQPNKEKASD